MAQRRVQPHARHDSSAANLRSEDSSSFTTGLIFAAMMAAVCRPRSAFVIRCGASPVASMRLKASMQRTLKARAFAPVKPIASSAKPSRVIW